MFEEWLSGKETVGAIHVASTVSTGAGAGSLKLPGVNVAVQQTTATVQTQPGGGTGSPLGQLQQAIQATLSQKTPSPSGADGRPSEPQTIDATVIPEPLH